VVVAGRGAHRQQPAERVAGEDRRLVTRVSLDERGGECVEVGEPDAARERAGLARPGQVDGDGPAAARAQLGEERAP
jgi:hypothetical protein